MPDLWTVLVSSVTALAGTVVGQWLASIKQPKQKAAK
jgi:hypothetical protein